MKLTFTGALYGMELLFICQFSTNTGDMDFTYTSTQVIRGHRSGYYLEKAALRSLPQRQRESSGTQGEGTQVAGRQHHLEGRHHILPTANTQKKNAKRQNGCLTRPYK